MANALRTRWKKIDRQRLILFDRLTLTVSGALLFIVWLMFLTKNFYPKSDDNLAALIMNLPLQISIWPITLFLLLIFVMPIWVTNHLDLIAISLLFSLLFLGLNIFCLFFINITVLWVLWLVINLVTTANVLFVLFSVYYLNKVSGKKNKSN